MKKSEELKLKMPIVFATEAPKGLIKNKIVSIGHADDFYQTSLDINDEFTKKFVAKYNENPGSYADRAYDGLMLLAEAMGKKKPDQTLENYLRNETLYNGYGTTYKFDEKGDIVGGEWIIEKL